MVKQVGSWVLRSVLGHGSFGEVHLSTHAETGKKVAVKVCAKQTLAKGQGRALLQREIATMKALDHDNVLRLYEVLETTKRFYLVIELATNGELFSLIKNNRGFDDATAKLYVRQLMDGVHYCHEQGVVHRDLKPQNLLLTSNNTLKIADFGFSRFQDLDENGQVSKSLRLQTQCGTPNYAAPEIFLGQGYDGFKTDIWACGVILYVMLSGGTVPFKPQGGNGLQGVIMAIVQGSYTIPSYFSENASSLIKRILVTEPAERITMRGIFKHPYVRKEEEPAFEIPKIVVSDDQVRNSIVKTYDDDDDAVAPQARKDPRAPSPTSPLAGALPRQIPTQTATPSPAHLLSSNGGSAAQPPRSPTSPSTPSSLAKQRARGATFTQQNTVNLGTLDVEPLQPRPQAHQDPAALLQSQPRSPVGALLASDKTRRQASFNTLGSPVDLGSSGSPTDSSAPRRTPSPTPSGMSLTGGSTGPAGLGSTTSSAGSAPLEARQNKSRSRTMVENSQEKLVGTPGQAGGTAAQPETRTAHVFKRKHWHTPRWCFYCGKCIYGVGKQGFSCILCECPVHIKCVDASSQNSCCEQFRARSLK